MQQKQNEVEWKMKKNMLFTICMVLAWVGFADLRIPVVAGSEGYAMDTNQDEIGETKIAGSKVFSMPIGETSVDVNEARVWLPFMLTADQKTAILGTNVSVMLSVCLTEKTATEDLTVSIRGVENRTSMPVHQTVYALSSEELVPAALTNGSALGLHTFDVTDFVQEEALRADGIGFAFRMQMADSTLLPNSNGVQNVFRIGSSISVDTNQIPCLIVSDGSSGGGGEDPDPDPVDSPGGTPPPPGVQVNVVYSYDGYAMDYDGDDSGEVKITGDKMPSLPVGESSVDTNEARVWIPFNLTEVQKTNALNSGASVALNIYLADKLSVGERTASIHGAGCRSAYRVNQNDYDTLTKHLVPNALSDDCERGMLSYDVTDFVKEEAGRSGVETNIGFGFLIRMDDEDNCPDSDGVQNAFKIGSSSSTVSNGPAHLVIYQGDPLTNPAVLNPADPAALRVLILGNSILRNSPLPDIGWAGNWGMAASCESNDFAHILMRRIEDTVNRPVEFMLHNIAFWENTWSTIRHDIPTVTYGRDFNPHIILSCISENTGLTDPNVPLYKAKYLDMISIMAGGLSDHATADVIVRGSFWTINTNTDLALSQAAAELGCPYIQCDFLSTSNNQAHTANYYLGPEPVDNSVLNHPNDNGMLAIADRIWTNALEPLLQSTYVSAAVTPGYYDWDERFGETTELSLTGPDGDFDGDGEYNFMEYIFAGSATNGVADDVLTVLTNGFGTVCAKVRSDDTNLFYAVDWANSLTGGWSSAALGFSGGEWAFEVGVTNLDVAAEETADGEWNVRVHRADEVPASFFRISVRAEYPGE